MADHSRTFEITIAALGVIVTGLIGFGQWQLSNKQSEFTRNQKEADAKRATDATEVQVMSIVAPHLVTLSKREDKDFHSSLRMVEAAAIYLSEKHGRTALAEMAERISRGNEAVPQETKTRLQEATVASAPSTTVMWFAVLDSLPANDQRAAETRANERNEQLRRIGLNIEVQLFKTKISNNFAVVAGGPVDQKAAFDLASTLRRNGIAGDAFAQQDREWTLVGKAPFR
ncbi:MAG: hypothetical protein ACKVQW_10095 [Pyrinomonadaceae bacterium]